MIKLYDRIKERSYTVGTGSFTLSGAFSGFSSFGSIYQNGDTFFYVANDGSNYELGSGVYVSSSNEVQRFPIKSSNNNQKVNFPEGLKEVYVNYPATNSVFNGSGIDVLPVNSGLAFWTSSNSLSSENYFFIDSGNHRIGVNKSNPSTAIDVGGSSAYSNVRASGFIVGSSGVYFPSGNNGNSGYTGGQQLTHFEMNQVSSDTFSNFIIDLSGNVNQHILLKKQNAGTFFAGPVSGCTPPCEPDYPTFRYIDIADLPPLSGIYSTKDYVDNKFSESNIETTIYSDGRLKVGDDIISSGYNLYYSRYSGSGINLNNYYVSLYDPQSSGWENYTIPLSPISLNSFDYTSYKLHDIFLYNDNNTLKISGVAWDENYVFNNLFLNNDFGNNFYSINFTSESSVNEDLLLNETPFAYNSLLINGNILAPGNTVLMTAQVDKSQNGLYEILEYNQNSGIFARGPTGFYPGDEISSTFKFYEDDRAKIWQIYDTNNNIIIGDSYSGVMNFIEWSLNPTSRSYSLTKMSNNAYVLTNDKSKRYVGTILPLENGIIIDDIRYRNVFNAHNQIVKPINISIPNTSWSYLQNSWRKIPYLSECSVVYGLNDQRTLNLDGVVDYSISNLQINDYSIAFSTNGDLTPSSGNVNFNLKQQINTDLYDNISLQLNASYRTIPTLGFTSFYLVEKGITGGGYVASVGNNPASGNFGGVFSFWKC